MTTFKQATLTLIAMSLITLAVACADGASSPTGPTGATGTTQGTAAVTAGAYATRSVADLPPSNPTTALSCPHDAPTQFTAKVDELTTAGWKVTFEWRPTSANVASYVLELRQRERNEGPSLPPTTSTLDGRTIHVRYLPAGIYSARLWANCGPESVKTSTEFAAGVGFPSGVNDAPVKKHRHHHGRG